MVKDAKDFTVPRKWKVCQHPDCSNKLLDDYIIDSDGNKRNAIIDKDYPEVCALYGEDFCFEHLSEESRAKYRETIKKLVEKDKLHALVGVNLFNAPLGGIELKGTNLNGANLQKANLKHAKLQGAYLADNKLQEAQLCSARLEGANLYRAKLQNTDLTSAHLENTILWGAVFFGARLAGVSWDNAQDLTWNQIRGGIQPHAAIPYEESLQDIGEEKTGYLFDAQDAYRRLKNYFHQQGQYKDESEAYYREKLNAKHEAFDDWFRSRIIFGKVLTAEDRRERRREQKRRFKAFFSWLWLAIFHRVTGFGERPLFTVLWALGFILLFSFIYWIGHSAGCFLFDFKPDMIPHLNFFSYIYLSVVTFATLGFGDITPLNWQAQIPVIIEVIMGYVFLGLIITIIARRFGR